MAATSASTNHSAWKALSRAATTPPRPTGMSVAVRKGSRVARKTVHNRLRRGRAPNSSR